MNGRVLIADGDLERGRGIAEACTSRGLQCTLVAQGAAALEEALGEVPGVVVVQLALPLISGPRLAEILDANPRTRGTGVVFLADAGAVAAPSAFGAQVIPDPADPDAVAGCVQVLLAGRPGRSGSGDAGGEEGGVEGQLSQLPLPDLLQLFHAAGRTGVVEVVRRSARGRAENGRIYLRGGDIVDAISGAVEGEKALYRLLAWDRGSFCFRPGSVGVAAGIQKPTRALLRDALRQIQEWEAAAADLPPLDAEVTIRVKRSKLPNVIYPLTQEVLMVLELHSRVRDVVDHCCFPDYQVLRTLRTLVDRGIVDLRLEPAAAEPGSGPGLFSVARAARLREWLDVARPRGGPRGDAKLLVLAADVEATRAFGRLLARVGGAELDPRAVDGDLDPRDLVTLGRIAVDPEVGIEVIQVPVDERFAPLWPLAGHGALASVVLTSTPLDGSARALRRVSDALRRQPRARVFHVVLADKEEHSATEDLRDQLELVDDSSVFALPLAAGETAETRFRELFGRVLP